jgi:hypothetical protein
MVKRSLAILAVGIAAGFLAVRTQGPLDRSGNGDAPYYSALARAVAAGEGYVLHRSPWPTVPDVTRLPLWPAMLVPGALLFPHAPEFLVVRWTAILVHAVCAVLLSILTWRVWSSSTAAWLAGLGYALYPPGLALLDAGDSEPACMVALLGGLTLVWSRNFRVQILGALICGASVLSRANLVILPVVFGGAAVLMSRSYWRRRRVMAVWSAAFLVLPVLWIARNYVVSGAFPLLSAMEGETLYGSNNAVVANDLFTWGSWVMPDYIPGEVKKQVLGRQMSGAALSAYYRRKGVEYFRANWFSYPRLVLGKLVRGFVPVPFAPLMSSYAASLCRALLFAAFLWYAGTGALRSHEYSLLLASMLLITLFTTVVYYGSVRFTFPLEVLLMPVVAAGIAGCRARDQIGRCTSN